MTLVLLTDQVLLSPDSPGKPLSPAKPVQKLVWPQGNDRTQMNSNCTNLWTLEVQCHLKVAKRVNINNTIIQIKSLFTNP